MPISLPEIWHIEQLKLVGYLLNIDHKIGRAKARSFLGYWFSMEEPKRLAAALFEHAGTQSCRLVELPTGPRLVFEGELQAPFGVMPRIRSVWLPDAEEPSARLVTAYPFDER